MKMVGLVGFLSGLIPPSTVRWRFLRGHPRILWVPLAEAVNSPDDLKERTEVQRGFQQSHTAALAVQIKSVRSTLVRSQEDRGSNL
jgi:hypothetical protein